MAEQPGAPLLAEATNVGPVQGEQLRGSVEAGPTRLGNFQVCGKEEMPGGLRISGARYQVVSKVLAPGESYQGEPGTMMYMSDDVKMQARWAGWRIFTGEGLAKLKYTNTGSETGYLGLQPNMPMAVVLPFDVGPTASLNCKRGAFMAGDEAVKVLPKLLPAKSCVACCCGGMPPVIQHLTGSGTALLNAGGTVIMKHLQPDEVLMVDTHSVVAFTDGIGSAALCHHRARCDHTHIHALPQPALLMRIVASQI